MKGKKRHDFIFRLACHLCHRPIAHKFNFVYDNIKIENSPYIVVSNHLTNWDPVLIAFSFGRNMYYVATDQIFRMGWKSKLLMYFFSPIARAKTAQETQTVITIFRRLKEKCNICIFVEGSTSFDGETGVIQPSIAKLVKKAGVTLVTYRFTGSYLTFPRWARFVHKGKMEGRLVQTYSPEKIDSMSENEIFEAIKNDIYVNAYADQEKNQIPYRGKNPAEYLETILYCCPKCKQLGTLTSCDDMLSCTCGFKARYNELGYFDLAKNSGQPPFKTIPDWIKWQKNEIETIAAGLGKIDINTPILTDEDQELSKTEKTYRKTFIAKGKLCLYKDRLSLTADGWQPIEFPLEAIIDISVFAKMTIIFSAINNQVFEIQSKNPRSALKYLDMIKAIKTITKE